MSLTKSCSKILPQPAIVPALLAVFVFKVIALSLGPGVGESEMNFNCVLRPFHDSAKYSCVIVEFLCDVFHDIQLYPFDQRSVTSLSLSRERKYQNKNSHHSNVKWP